MADDVARVAGVLLSPSAAREIVAALDHLARLAAPRGQQLSERVRLIARELAISGTREPTRVDMRAEGVAAQFFGESELCVADTATAARMLGMTPGGVAWLCRNGRLTATRVGGRWLVDTASLRTYNDCRKERCNAESVGAELDRLAIFDVDAAGESDPPESGGRPVGR